MKRIYLLPLLLTIALMFINTAWVNLTLVKPAQLALPVHINKLAVIDRTDKVESRETKLEEVITGEMFQQDEQAIQQLVEGTLYLCDNYRRFEIIRTGHREISDGTKNIFPKPLNWKEVTYLCNKYKSDALFAIEIFDSDFIVSHNPFEVETKDKSGNIIKSVRFKAVGVAVINIGIRIYDPVNKQIADEYRYTERLNFDASGATIDAAVNSLLNKVEAINKASYDAGIAYGKRISPWYYKQRREFYNRPKKAKYLQEGVRKSEVADWEGAIESWQKVFTSKHKKDKKAHGKAAFNIAVAHEVLGDLEKAKEWAAKAYTEYEDKEADDYYKQLQKRIRQENILKAQLGE